MKVLHLGKLSPPNEGSIEIFSFNLLEALNEKGIKVDILYFGVLEDLLRGILTL
jgi:N-acetyllactosaminide 3-alpha-galactosyltransferase/rhamnosyl/mannosyltransferase